MLKWQIQGHMTMPCNGRRPGHGNDRVSYYFGSSADRTRDQTISKIAQDKGAIWISVLSVRWNHPGRGVFSAKYVLRSLPLKARYGAVSSAKADPGEYRYSDKMHSRFR
jgi:hypothetical protein